VVNTPHADRLGGFVEQLWLLVNGLCYPQVHVLNWAVGRVWEKKGVVALANQGLTEKRQGKAKAELHARDVGGEGLQTINLKLRSPRLENGGTGMSAPIDQPGFLGQARKRGEEVKVAKTEAVSYEKFGG